MRAAVLIRRAGFLLLALAAALCLPASAQTYEPQSGQAGKDVVWVPTPQALVEKMLDMAKVTPEDFVIDLGSGDGRTVISAAKRGATALGIEYNPDMVELSRRAAEKEGVAAKASFVKADLFESDFSRATVVTMFLLPSINLKLRPKLLALKPGTRIVSNSFNMDQWEADEHAFVTAEQGCAAGFCTALFWVVPAQVAGTYRLPEGEVTLVQRFQMLTGVLSAEGVILQVQGRVRGEEIRFTAGGRDYRARKAGERLELLP